MTSCGQTYCANLANSTIALSLATIIMELLLDTHMIAWSALFISPCAFKGKNGQLRRKYNAQTGQKVLSFQCQIVLYL